MEGISAIHGHTRSFDNKKMWQANFERSKIEHLTFEMISNNFCFDQMRSCIYNLFTRIDLECPQLIEHSLLLLNIHYHPSLYNFIDRLNYLSWKTSKLIPTLWFLMNFEEQLDPIFNRIFLSDKNMIVGMIEIVQCGKNKAE